MYGSYPEITISMRFAAAKLQRIKTFFSNPPEKKWPISYEDLLNIAERILKEKEKNNLSRPDRIQTVTL